MSKQTGKCCDLKAFVDERFDYYELTESIGFLKHGVPLLPKGSVFVHDTGDEIKGSPAEGCLKLCWTPGGGCYGSLCADSVIFHAEFRRSNLFKKVDSRKIQSLKQLIENLSKQLDEAKAELSKLM